MMGASRRLRVLIGAWGSTGDVMPLVAVGAELQRRAHDVVFVANPYFSRPAAEAGLRFVPIGSVEDHEGLMADSNLFGPQRKTWEVIYSRHYYPRVPEFYRAIDAIVQEQGADIIVGYEVGTAAVAERRRLPRARIAPSSVRFGSRYDPAHPEGILPESMRWMAGGPRRMALWYRLQRLRQGWFRWPSRARLLPEDHPLAAFRRSVGLPSQADDASCPVIGLWPDWFSPPQRDWPANAVTTGFALYPPPTLNPTPVADPAARPIVATTGSVAGSQAPFYEAVVAACRSLHRGAILVTPHGDQIPQNLPPGVSHVAHAPFNETFHHAALVIHHGGIGTAAYALAAGVPQIIVPMRGDQYDNGNRLVRLGVADMVAIDPSAPDRFVATVGSMLASRRVAEACRRWQARVDPESGVREASNVIESLAT